MCLKLLERKKEYDNLTKNLTKEWTFIGHKLLQTL